MLDKIATHGGIIRNPTSKGAVNQSINSRSYSLKELFTSILADLPNQQAKLINIGYFVMPVLINSIRPAYVFLEGAN